MASAASARGSDQSRVRRAMAEPSGMAVNGLQTWWVSGGAMATTEPAAATEGATTASERAPGRVAPAPPNVAARGRPLRPARPARGSLGPPGHHRRGRRRLRQVGAARPGHAGEPGPSAWRRGLRDLPGRLRERRAADGVHRGRLRRHRRRPGHPARPGLRRLRRARAAGGVAAPRRPRAAGGRTRPRCSTSCCVGRRRTSTSCCADAGSRRSASPASGPPTTSSRSGRMTSASTPPRSLPSRRASAPRRWRPTLPDGRRWSASPSWPRAARVDDFVWEEVIRSLGDDDRSTLLALCLLGPSTIRDVEAVTGRPRRRRCLLRPGAAGPPDRRAAGGPRPLDPLPRRPRRRPRGSRHRRSAGRRRRRGPG